MCHNKTMAFTLLNIMQILLQFLLLLSVFSTSQPLNIDSLCSTTLYPSFCKLILAENHLHTNTTQDYGRFCIVESLSMANNLNLLVKHNLESSNQIYVSQSTKKALQDCESLTSLNIGFLNATFDIIKLSNSLGSMDTDQVHTMLSAAMTNLDTCLDGLKEAQPQSNATKELSPHISNGTMLLSLSLEFFTKGWVQKTNPNDYLPLKFDQSSRIIDYYGNTKNNGRSMLQLGKRRIKVKTMVVVNPDGSGNFNTIKQAVDAAPTNTKPNHGYFVIHVVSGVYEEYVSIPSNKKYLYMVGDGINKTIITGDRSVGSGNWTTYNSATFAVTAVGFVAENISFRNTAGAIMHQAVALRNGADLSAFHRCSFEGYQDTLYVHSMRQFYKECDVYGTVDFIFGNAAVVLQNCNIYARQPLKGQFNTITAQGRTDPNQNTGISIQSSMIRATDDLASSTYDVKTYLGRPWKEFSRTAYLECFMGWLIAPDGWHEWAGSFALDTLYYAEYQNIGPGSMTFGRVTWPGYHVIDDTIASYFTVSYFIDGDFWLPSTGVPYTLGLN